MRRHWWVSGTRARRPLARHLAGQHGSAAPHAGGSPVPFRQGARHTGPVPHHAPRALCWGEGASAPGREGGVDVQTHAWSTSHSMRQFPRQPTARASRCERVFNISIPRPQSPGPLEGKGLDWGEGGREGRQKPLPGGSKGQELELPGAGCLGKGRGRRARGRPWTSPPPPFFYDSPACQAARPSACTERRREGRAGPAPREGGWGRGLAPLSGFSSSWREHGCLEPGYWGLQRRAGM